MGWACGLEKRSDQREWVLATLMLFTGSKGCYELRKICIDHIYQKYGVEMASSISGDDIRTVMRYYADPSAVHVENVRVVDLL